MAEIPAQDLERASNYRLFKWEDVTENDTCEAVKCPAHSDVTFMVEGAFGGDGVGIEGTLDPFYSVFVPLNDLSGSQLDITADAAMTVLENMYAVRPRTPDGTSVSVNCWVLVVGGK